LVPADIQTGSLTSADIQDGSVTGLDILDGSIGSADVQNGSIGLSEINSAEVQRRVASTCTAGSSIRAIAVDGTVTCETDDAPAAAGG
jgi:hypothetical protein